MEASKRETDGGDRVAILILLELTLQFSNCEKQQVKLLLVAILILLELTLQ